MCFTLIIQNVSLPAGWSAIRGNSILGKLNHYDAVWRFILDVICCFYSDESWIFDKISRSLCDVQMWQHDHSLAAVISNVIWRGADQQTSRPADVNVLEQSKNELEFRVVRISSNQTRRWTVSNTLIDADLHLAREMSEKWNVNFII